MMQEKKSSVHKNEVNFSVDIEAAGPVPGEYSMLSIGVCNVESPKKSFYIEIKPINNCFIPESLAVSGFSLDRQRVSGTTSKNALDIKAYYMGFSGSAWVDASSSRLPPWLRPTGRKRHNTLEDAVDQAGIFANLLSARRSSI